VARIPIRGMTAPAAALMFCLAVLGAGRGFLAQEAPEIIVEKYRRYGRDPMVAKIVIEEKEEATPGEEEPGTEETVTQPQPGTEGTGEEPGAVSMYKRNLNRYKTLAQRAMMRREYESVISHCEKGLKEIKDIREQKTIIISKSLLAGYERNFKRWLRAAREGIIQSEALENFKKRRIVLQGIVWDEKDPVVILDGNSFKEGDPYKGIRIEKIRPQRVDVVFLYKGRAFKYTLEFPEE